MFGHKTCINGEVGTSYQILLLAVGVGAPVEFLKGFLWGMSLYSYKNKEIKYISL